jgi:hypothetical protein
MSDNVIDLIRGVNPFPDELPAPAIEPVRRRLEGGDRGTRSPARKARLPTLDATLGALGVATAVAVAVLAIALLGHSRSRTATSNAAISTTSAAPLGQDNLSGTWSGHFTRAYYSGGTLLISWRQSGWKQTSPGIWHSNLNGSIKLSNLPSFEVLLIRGTVLTTCRQTTCYQGITFHTVGVEPSLSVLGGGLDRKPNRLQRERLRKRHARHLPVGAEGAMAGPLERHTARTMISL